MSLKKILERISLLVVLALLLGRSVVAPGDEVERVRAYTRQIEFDYVEWTIDAALVKLKQVAVNSAVYLPAAQRQAVVRQYIVLIQQIQQGEAILNEIYMDPQIEDPYIASTELRADLGGLYLQRRQLGPVAEAIVQSQLSVIAADMGLAYAGQPLPPVLYHSSPLPMALIVSPRDVIRQDADISLLPDLSLAEQASLEERVDEGLNVSSLVVGIGGIGVYPTMVMQTSDLNWLGEVVAHEWTHNYLTLRPLGINYFTTPQLRTMNETAASIAGKEIGRQFIATYYPELLPPPPPPPAEPTQPAPPSEPLPFDFRAEMRTTRLQVDAMLAEGKIAEAEAYMEARRVFFWENGYHLRKINQAYFAFYGAYADQPGGAAGEDPVGAAVRALRAQSQTLAGFLNRISWMTSYDQLERAVAEDGADVTLSATRLQLPGIDGN